MEVLGVYVGVRPGVGNGCWSRWSGVEVDMECNLGVVVGVGVDQFMGSGDGGSEA